MIILDCEQGTDAWFQGRLGIPTASNFDKIITSTGKASTQAKSYMNKLLAEWLTGSSINQDSTEWMERGNLLEADARSLFEFTNECEVSQVGLIYKDDRKLVSCSPDGLIDDSGLEIKCPAPHTHVEYLLSGKLPSKYVAQVQGSMWVTERDSWNFMSYHPEMQPLSVKVNRDDKFIKTLEDYVNDFIDEMLTKRQKLDEARKVA